MTRELLRSRSFKEISMPVFIFMVWFIYTGMLYAFLIAAFGHQFASDWVIPISFISAIVFALIALSISELRYWLKKRNPPA